MVKNNLFAYCAVCDWELATNPLMTDPLSSEFLFQQSTKHCEGRGHSVVVSGEVRREYGQEATIAQSA